MHVSVQNFTTLLLHVDAIFPVYCFFIYLHSCTMSSTNLVNARRMRTRVTVVTLCVCVCVCVCVC